jgi:hypothetical protein
MTTTGLTANERMIFDALRSMNGPLEQAQIIYAVHQQHGKRMSRKSAWAALTRLAERGLITGSPPRGRDPRLWAVAPAPAPAVEPAVDPEPEQDGGHVTETPISRRVPTGPTDPLGRYREHVNTLDAEAASHWDARSWIAGR